MLTASPNHRCVIMRRLRSGSDRALVVALVAVVVVVVVVVVAENWTRASSGQTGHRRSGSDADPQAKHHGPRSKVHASALVTAGAARGEVHTSALVTAGAALQVRPGASACDRWDWRTPLLPLPSSEPPSPVVGQKAAEESAESLESARAVSGPALARLQSSPARTERDAAPEEPLPDPERSATLLPAQATHSHSKPLPPLPSSEATHSKPLPSSEEPLPDPERSATLLPAQATHSHSKPLPPLPSSEATHSKPLPEASPAQERDVAPQASHSTHSTTRPLQTSLSSWSMSGRSKSPQATHSTTRPLQTATQHEEPERQVENVVQAHHRCQHEEPERQVENVVQARQLAGSYPLACH